MQVAGILKGFPDRSRLWQKAAYRDADVTLCDSDNPCTLLPAGRRHSQVIPRHQPAVAEGCCRRALNPGPSCLQVAGIVKGFSDASRLWQKAAADGAAFSADVAAHQPQWRSNVNDVAPNLLQVGRHAIPSHRNIWQLPVSATNVS